MNWEAIGAVGEIVGATAVVVTLIYVAVQVRHGDRDGARRVRGSHGAERGGIDERGGREEAVESATCARL